MDAEINEVKPQFSDSINSTPPSPLLLFPFIRAHLIELSPLPAQVRESWQTYELDLINYQNKCRIIRGWDDLFTKVKEHINSVTAMKLSPYFKVFEDDTIAWEDRLNRINALFDVWIDVQRRWVYLEGIFTGSADIKHLLPNESQRFLRLVKVFFLFFLP